MRLIRSLLLPLCIVPALAAQTPAQSPAPVRRAPLPVPRSLSVDLAAARDHIARLLVEPLVFGRVSVGFSGSYTDHAEAPSYPYPVPMMDPIPNAPCPPNCYGPPSEPDYQAGTLDLNVRWYPAALSMNSPQAKAMVYVGEFIGFTQRRVGSSGYFYCPVCERPLSPDSNPPIPIDSGYVPPNYPPMPWPGPGPENVQRFEAVEPGVELGVRIQAAQHFFFDIGGRWRLVRVDDPYSKKRPGDVDPRLVVAGGISW